MCTELLICHGDKAKLLPHLYSEEQRAQIPDNCNLATFYISRDGQYAVDADFVPESERETADLTKVPKIKLR
jgi:hypothetical protein